MEPQTLSKPLVLVLAHDLTDSAILKRCAMLQAGGARFTIAGFRRGHHIIDQISGQPAIDLGQTSNGTFVRRMVSVLRVVGRLLTKQLVLPQADVILARNLEMLIVGVAARIAYFPRSILIYEVLDIHRLLSGKTLVSDLLRLLERVLLRQASGIVTSSPAFISGYFRKLNETSLPIKLLENKIFSSRTSKNSVQTPAPSQPPWIIGWFGIIRCRKSLGILTDLVRQSGGSVRVVIRGKPALDQLHDFHEIVAKTTGLTFEGSYQAEDLPSIYSGVHFAWAIDFYEEGLNSSWLLPNRLYEASYFGAVPIALKDVQTGKYLEERLYGVTLSRPYQANLESFIRGLDSERYEFLQRSQESVAPAAWTFQIEDCDHLVSFLASPLSERQYIV